MRVRSLIVLAALALLLCCIATQPARGGPTRFPGGRALDCKDMPKLEIRGFLYLLYFPEHPQHSGSVKVGVSEVPGALDRVKTHISAVGSQHKFKARVWVVSSPYSVEAELKRLFQPHRDPTPPPSGQTEWFTITPNKALIEIRKIIGNVKPAKMWTSPRARVADTDPPTSVFYMVETENQKYGTKFGVTASTSGQRPPVKRLNEHTAGINAQDAAAQDGFKMRAKIMYVSNARILENALKTHTALFPAGETEYKKWRDTTFKVKYSGYTEYRPVSMDKMEEVVYSVFQSFVSQGISDGLSVESVGWASKDLEALLETNSKELPPDYVAVPGTVKPWKGLTESKCPKTTTPNFLEMWQRPKVSLRFAEMLQKSRVRDDGTKVAACEREFVSDVCGMCGTTTVKVDVSAKTDLPDVTPEFLKNAVKNLGGDIQIVLATGSGDKNCGFVSFGADGLSLTDVVTAFGETAPTVGDDVPGPMQDAVKKLTQTLKVKRVSFVKSGSAFTSFAVVVGLGDVPLGESGVVLKSVELMVDIPAKLLRVTSGLEASSVGISGGKAMAIANVGSSSLLMSVAPTGLKLSSLAGNYVTEVGLPDVAVDHVSLGLSNRGVQSFSVDLSVEDWTMRQAEPKLALKVVRGSLESEGGTTTAMVSGFFHVDEQAPLQGSVMVSSDKSFKATLSAENLSLVKYADAFFGGAVSDFFPSGSLVSDLGNLEKALASVAFSSGGNMELQLSAKVASASFRGLAIGFYIKRAGAEKVFAGALSVSRNTMVTLVTKISSSLGQVKKTLEDFDPEKTQAACVLKSAGTVAPAWTKSVVGDLITPSDKKEMRIVGRLGMLASSKSKFGRALRALLGNAQLALRATLSAEDISFGLFVENVEFTSGGAKYVLRSVGVEISKKRASVKLSLGAKLDVPLTSGATTTLEGAVSLQLGAVPKVVAEFRASLWPNAFGWSKLDLSNMLLGFGLSTTPVPAVTDVKLGATAKLYSTTGPKRPKTPTIGVGATIIISSDILDCKVELEAKDLQFQQIVDVLIDSAPTLPALFGESGYKKAKIELSKNRGLVDGELVVAGNEFALRVLVDVQKASFEASGSIKKQIVVGASTNSRWFGWANIIFSDAIPARKGPAVMLKLTDLASRPRVEAYMTAAVQVLGLSSSAVRLNLEGNSFSFTMSGSMLGGLKGTIEVECTYDKNDLWSMVPSIDISVDLWGWNFIEVDSITGGANGGAAFEPHIERVNPDGDGGDNDPLKIDGLEITKAVIQLRGAKEIKTFARRGIAMAKFDVKDRNSVVTQTGPIPIELDYERGNDNDDDDDDEDNEDNDDDDGSNKNDDKDDVGINANVNNVKENMPKMEFKLKLGTKERLVKTVKDIRDGRAQPAEARKAVKVFKDVKNADKPSKLSRSGREAGTDVNAKEEKQKIARVGSSSRNGDADGDSAAVGVGVSSAGAAATGLSGVGAVGVGGNAANNAANNGGDANDDGGGMLRGNEDGKESRGHASNRHGRGQ